jgi:hypothetical protein
MLRNKVVTDPAGEAAAAAFEVQTQQVIAIGVGFAEPQFAHGAAGRKKFKHFKGSPGQ